MEKIVHTAKQTVKAMVDMVSARRDVVSCVGVAGCNVIIGSFNPTA